jgi:hypothetical protein
VPQRRWNSAISTPTTALPTVNTPLHMSMPRFLWNFSYNRGCCGTTRPVTQARCRVGAEINARTNPPSCIGGNETFHLPYFRRHTRRPL